MKSKKKILQMLCPYLLLGCDDLNENVEFNKMAYLVDSFAEKDEVYKTLEDCREKEEAIFNRLVGIFKSIQGDYERVSQEYQKQMGMLAGLYEKNEKYEDDKYVLENEYENDHDINTHLKRQNSVYSNEGGDIANLNSARQRLQILNNDKDDLKDKIIAIAKKIINIKEEIGKTKQDTIKIEADLKALETGIEAIKTKVNSGKENIKKTLGEVIKKLELEYNGLITQISNVLDKNKTKIVTNTLELEHLPCYDNFVFGNKQFDGKLYNGALMNNEIFCNILAGACFNAVKSIGKTILDYSHYCKDEKSVGPLQSKYCFFLKEIVDYKGEYSGDLRGSGLSAYLNGQHPLKGFSKVCKYNGSYNMESGPLYGDNIAPGILGNRGNPANGRVKNQIDKLLNIFYTWFSDTTYIKYDNNNRMLGARNYIVYSLFKNDVCVALKELRTYIGKAGQDCEALNTSASDYLSRAQTLSTQLGSICALKDNLKSKIEESLRKYYILECIKVKFRYNKNTNSITFEKMDVVADPARWGTGIQIVNVADIKSGDTDIANAKFPEYVGSYDTYLKQNAIKKFDQSS